MKPTATGLRFASAADCETAFYTAFRSGDIPAMEQAWGDDPGLMCIHPGRPLLAGRAAVLASWREILGASGGLQVRFELHQRHESDNLAVHIGMELIGPADAEPALVSVTNVYLRRDGDWRMLAHHAAPIHRGAAPRHPRGPLH